MRVILWFGMLLQAALVQGQAGPVMVSTVEDAISAGLRCNPQLESKTGKENLARNIKSNWYEWLYRINRLMTIKEQLQWLGDLERVAERRYDEGDISIVEKSSFLSEALKIRTEALVLASEAEISGNRLKQLIRCPSGITPADSCLFIYQIHKEDYDAPVSETPEDSLAVVNLRLRLDSYFALLHYYTTFGLEHAGLILQTGRAKYNAEETDYLEFTRNISEAFAIRMEYLKTVNDYNQTAIELEYYGY